MKRMRLCVKLMKLVQDEFYSSEYSDYHKTKHWFELENHGLLEGADIENFEFEDIEDDGRETW